MRPIQELCLLKKENAIGSTVNGSRASYKVEKKALAEEPV